MNNKIFGGLRRQLAKNEERRESLYIMSRECIRLSKKVIYGIHRGAPVKKDLGALRKKATALKKGRYHPFSKVAFQEFVEAEAFFSYTRKKKLPSPKSLGVDAEAYLMGLCDLSGEIVRYAINKSIKKKFGEAIRAKDFLSELYYELMQFDFRNSELRKKFDGVKYDLKKLEDLALNISLK